MTAGSLTSNAAVATLNIAEKTAQTISFGQSGPLYYFISDTFANTASGLGSGAITYSSSDTAVATVAADGTVNILASGSATITATKSADSTYKAATANYVVNSVARAQKIFAWIGASDTLVKTPANASGTIFYRSRAANCDLVNYASCDHGARDVLASAAITDNALTLTQDAYYTFQHGSASISFKSTVSREKFGDRVTTATVFNNKMWVIGGNDGALKNDIWSSADGVVWTQETAAAAFSARYFHQALVFSNKMWVLGGTDGNSKNDVWSSDDGLIWRAGMRWVVTFP